MTVEQKLFFNAFGISPDYDWWCLGQKIEQPNHKALNQIGLAGRLAIKLHEGQKRKYDGEDYVRHCFQVAEYVARADNATTDMICAALLHDTLEDTQATAITLAHSGVNHSTLAMIVGMTDCTIPADGNRAARKKFERARLAGCSAAVHTIKVADLCSNAESIFEHDPGFAKVFAREMADLLEVLVCPDVALNDLAWTLLKDYQTPLLLQGEPAPQWFMDHFTINS